MLKRALIITVAIIVAVSTSSLAKDSVEISGQVQGISSIEPAVSQRFNPDLLREEKTVESAVTGYRDEPYTGQRRITCNRKPLLIPEFNIKSYQDVFVSFDGESCSESNYDVMISIGPRCYGAHICYMYFFSRQQLTSSAQGALSATFDQFLEPVKLSNGVFGYLIPTTLGAHPTPIRLVWIERDSLFIIGTKGGAIEELAKSANSIIKKNREGEGTQDLVLSPTNVDTSQNASNDFQSCQLSYESNFAFEQSIISRFWVGMEKTQVDSILRDKCNAKLREHNNPDAKSTTELTFYELPVDDHVIRVEFRQSKLWTLRTLGKRILPTGNAQLVTISQPAYSIAEIRGDLKKFRFELFPSREDLREALAALFNVGARLKDIDSALVVGGSATKSSCKSEAFASAYEGFCYEYYLRSESGRREPFARRNVAAFFDKDHKLIGVTMGSVIIQGGK